MKEKILLSYGKGITHSPADLLCQDGELEECINLEVKNDELKPIEMPLKLGISLSQGERLVYVHNIKNGVKNYITLDSGVLKAFQIVDGEKDLYDLNVSCGEILSIQSIGNTIVVYTEASAHYILYKDDGYKYLGDSIPELGLKFNLKGTMLISETFDVDVPSKNNNADLSSEENRKSATEQIIPEVNKFIAEESEAKGRFIFPFFIRYAYKLYDGTYTMQSAPVLMLPSTTIAPLCGYVASSASRPPFKTFIAAVPSVLEIHVSSNDTIEDWSEIISEVSVFVSSPIRTYDQEGEITAGRGDKFYSSMFYGDLNHMGEKKYRIEDNFNLSSNDPLSFVRWELPSKSIEGVMSEISSCSLFYKYFSLSPSEIKSYSSYIINPEEVGVNPVSGIEFSERLPDDYMTHDRLIPQNSFVYNSRLNISNIRRRLFQGFTAVTMTQVGIHEENPGNPDVYTYIRTSNGDKIVKSSHEKWSSYVYGIYLFYPDTDAYKMIIHDSYNSKYAEVPLIPHPTLNGAYYLASNFVNLTFIDGDPSITETEDNYEVMANKLFTSSLNNPFHFPLEGIYTIGTGEIIGMSAITRPISQGQFGEYPLIMFCTDGNYAMKVDSQGFYAAISPIQEDVVLGNDKIVSMENSLAVITKKGLMLTTGGEMSRIASHMDGGISDYSLLDSIETSVSDITTLVDSSSDNKGFLSYLYGSKMAFDYASNRLLIYDPLKSYSYVYNFDSNTVSKMVLGSGANIVSSVMDYPDVIIQDANGILYSLYEKEDINLLDERRYGMALTRPLKMGGAMTMKSIKQILMLSTHGGNGSFVKYLLYGSNDNVNYHKVSSRFGKPYKYYRIAIYTLLLPKESLEGSVVTIENRRDHKLRG